MDTTKKTCAICRLGNTHEYVHGNWKKADDVDVHLFCLLLSKVSPQRSEVDDGIGITTGVLVKDIKDYTKIENQTKCHYCQENHASVKCAQNECLKWWHVSCGYENKCLPIFEGEFLSYCNNHVEIAEKYEIHGDSSQCKMCKEPMGAYHAVTSIPSCCNQGYYHRKCMQINANAAGYLAKCPSCGEDAKGYRTFLSNRGIFCPDKDADRELVEHAYEHAEWSKCTAAVCLCPNGKEHVGESPWCVENCQYCHANGVHVGCREGDAEVPFTCIDCGDKPQSQPPSQPSQPLSSTFHETPNNEEQPTVDLPDVSNTVVNDEEHQSNVSNHSDKMDVDPTIPLCNRQQSEASKVETKVWKLVETKSTIHRSHSLVLVESTDNTHVDPLCKSEIKEMGKSQVEHFLQTADFSAKPSPLPWIV